MHFVASPGMVWYIFQRRNLIKKQCKHFLLHNCIVSLSLYYHNSCFSLSSSSENSGEFVVMRWPPTPLEFLYHPGISLIFLLGRWGRTRGAGARENSRRKGYGRREKKEREAGSLRWRKRERNLKINFRYLLLLIIQSKKRTQQHFLDFHLTFSEA